MRLALLAATLVGLTAPAASAAVVARALPEPAQRGHEVASLRTAYSSTFALSDGTRRTEVSATPINYRDGQGGRWAKIDLGLRSTGDRGLAPTALPFSLRLPKTLGEGGRVSVSRGRDAVSFAPHALRSEATASRSTATYRGAYRGADVSWSSAVNGVKEIISLRDRSAPRRFVYDLTLSDGLRPVLQPSGQIEIRRGGDQVGVIPAPWMKDAAGVTSSAAAYRLKRAGGGWQIVLSIDDDWVSAPARKFPIAVDPSYELSQATWCNVPTRPSGVAACAGPLELGGTPIFTSVLRWEHVTDAIPYGSQVLSASINLNATGGSGPVDVNVRELSQPFSPDSLAGLRGGSGSAPWQDGVDGGQWFALGKRIESKTTVTPAAGSTVPVSLGVSRLVQGWVDGYLNNPSSAPWPAGSPFTNRGVLLSLDQPGGSVQFADGSSGVSGPRLSVVWEPRSGDRSSANKYQVRVGPSTVVKVDRANGELLVDDRDVSIAGPLGPALNFSRVYSGRSDVSTEPGILGTAGWTDNIADPSLQTSGFDQTRILRWLDGGRYRFDQNLSTGLWEDGSPDGSMNLVKRTALDPDGTGFTLSPTVATTPEGHANDSNKYLFDDGASNGQSDDRLKKAIAPDGGAVTYTRMANGIRATDANGRWIKLHVNADGKLDTVTDNTGKVWHYIYNDPAGHLTAVTSPDGWTMSYAYETDPTKPARLTNVYAQLPTGSTRSVTVTYGADGKVSALTPGSSTGTARATFTYPTPYQTDEVFPTPGFPGTGQRRTLSWRGLSYQDWDPKASPTASASGALLNLKDKYTKGDSTVSATVTADRDAGSYLRSFGLRNTGLGRTLGTTNTNCTVPLPPPYSGVVPRGDSCPNPVSAQYNVSLPALPEGANTFRAVSTNDAALQGQSDPWTVYIDRTAPTNIAASGELWDLKDQYINGTGTRAVTVAAHDPLLEDDSRGAGVQHLALEDIGHGIIAQTDVACDPNTCPVDASQNLSVDASQLAEGAHQFRVVATDLVGNVSQSDPWTVLVDKTGPPAAGGFDAVYGSDDLQTDISWDPSDDPALADASAGSGTVSYNYRYQPAGGAWSAWAAVDGSDDAVSDLSIGDHVNIEVQAVDAVGNVGPTGSGNVVVSTATLTPDAPGQELPSEVGQPANPNSITPEPASWAGVDPEGTMSSDDDDSPASAPVPNLIAPLAAPRFDLDLCDNGSPCGKYKGAAAANYAHQWYAKRNGRYRTNLGSDCTNFVSQALHYGGLHFLRTKHKTNDPDGRQHDTSDYVRGADSWWSYFHVNPGKPQLAYASSTSWTVSWVLYNQLVNTGIGVTLDHSNGHLKVGDVIFYRLTGGQIDHVQIVTKVTSRYVLVAQHARDYEQTFARTLRDIRGHSGWENMSYTVVRPKFTAINIHS